jgi:hypothetical protein
VTFCRGDAGQILQGDRDLPARAQRSLQLERLPVERRRPCQIALSARHIPKVAELKRFEISAAQLPRERERLGMARFCACQIAQIVMSLAKVSKGTGNLPQIAHRTRLRQTLLPSFNRPGQVP